MANKIEGALEKALANATRCVHHLKAEDG